MTTLRPTDRKGFEDVFDADFGAIQEAVTMQIKKIWASARAQIEKERGWDKLYSEREDLKKQKEQIEQRLHEIELTIQKEPLSKQQVIELGGKKNQWDHYKGAEFCGIPVESQFEYDIVQLIKEHIDMEAPAKYVRDLYFSCKRELAMVGSFEDAKKVYEQFYSLDFRKYGVGIAPRLSDIKSKNPLLNGPRNLLPKDTLQLERQQLAYDKVEGIER